MRLLFLILGLLCHATTASAQEWPTKPVRIIVPFPPGGSADLLPRIVGEKLAQQWGQPVIIENRPGAGGNIGATGVFQAEPDGYTLLSAPPPPLVINRLIYPKLTYDSTQFVPMTVIAAIPNVLLVHPKVTANSVSELIAYAKQNPGRLNYASQGSGTTSHLTAELFQLMAKVKLRHIPYRGSAPALQGLLAGDVDLMFDNLGVSLPLVEDGKLRLLAVASTRRMPSLPEVPTLAETLPGFEAVAWYAIVAPPGTPKAIVDKINADVNEALRQPEMQDRLKKLSAEVFGGSVERTAAYMKEEVARWGNVIKAAGVTLQ